MSFLSKWNPFSRISEEVSEFPEARKILYNVLHNWSKNLADPDVDLDSVGEIAQMLMDLGSDFEEINVDDLNLNVSYVGKIDLPSPPARPKRKRWTHTVKKPITLMTKVPRGWNDQEPDLDPE